MDRAYVAYETRNDHAFAVPPNGQGCERMVRRGLSVGKVIGAGVGLGAVLLAGGALQLLALFAAYFDAPEFPDALAAVRYFWGRDVARPYVLALVLLTALLVPIARLAGRGGGHPGRFMVGGVLGLLGQFAMLHTTVALDQAMAVEVEAGNLIDFLVFAVPVAWIVIVPVALVCSEWLLASPHRDS